VSAPALTTVGHARAIVEIDTLTRAEWLAARRIGLGGSDAAAVAGLDPYRSPFEIWLDKTGTLPDDDRAGEAALWGRLLEPVIADELARRDAVEISPVGWMLGHPEHHHMIADVDRVALDPARPAPGIVEIKSTSAFRAGDWRDGVPIPVVCQVMHYLAVTGLDWARIVALIGGQNLVVHDVERDDELIDNLIEIEARFWRQVIDREPPEPDGSRATTDLLGRLYDVDPDAVAVVDRAEIEPALAALRFARERQDAAENDRRRAENEIKLQMGGAAMLVDVDGVPIARWPQVETRRIDVDGLRAGHPEIAERYTTVTTSRRFTVPKR
jgi:putative phage-type endonuclease